LAETRSRSGYLKHFEAAPLDKTRQLEALRVALDIRKFEIELYWKRAAYFWTFIAATLAGYVLLQQKAGPDSFEATYMVTCLGFTFSLAWYFVNRGSKSWQRNWEAQVDLLEDEVIGPLYKSEINRYGSKFWDLTAGYHFSPSRINQLLGVFVTVVWLGLIVRTLSIFDWSRPSHKWTFAVMSILTVSTCAAFWFVGRSSEATSIRWIHHSLRKYEDNPV
jgi:hypothetical protein